MQHMWTRGQGSASIALACVLLLSERLVHALKRGMPC